MRCRALLAYNLVTWSGFHSWEPMSPREADGKSQTQPIKATSQRRFIRIFGLFNNMVINDDALSYGGRWRNMLCHGPF